MRDVALCREPIHCRACFNCARNAELREVDDDAGQNWMLPSTRDGKCADWMAETKR